MKKGFIVVGWRLKGCQRTGEPVRLIARVDSPIQAVNLAKSDRDPEKWDFVVEREASEPEIERHALEKGEIFGYTQ